MSDTYDYLANVVLAIRDDKKLREAFNQVLKFGTSTQQVRVAKLKVELVRLNAPDEVMKFVRLLEDDKLAHQVLNEINK